MRTYSLSPELVILRAPINQHVQQHSTKNIRLTFHESCNIFANKEEKEKIPLHEDLEPKRPSADFDEVPRAPKHNLAVAHCD